MTIPSSEGFLSSESCLPLTPDEERDTITELTRAAQANLEEGDVFYVISRRWLSDWEVYVQIESNKEDSVSLKNSDEGCPNIPKRPGTIDNSELISYETDKDSSGGLDLRKNLQEHEHYCLVPREVWKKLHEWYKGGPELPRKVIDDGFVAKNLVIEVYPLCLQLIDARDYSKRTIRISRQASVGELYKEACRVLNLEQTKVDIWEYHQKMKFSLLKDFDKILQESLMHMDQHMDQEILMEVKDDEPCSSGMDSTENGFATVPMEASRSPVSTARGLTFANGSSIGLGSRILQENNFSSSLVNMEDHDDILSNRRGDVWGLTGLHNLGNTCFMNSALQCLVHTPHLVQFFLQDYTEQINRHNLLGTQGELAISFGDLVRKLCSSGRTSYSPCEFKATLARFAPQFSGYSQHDSQELLAFLLDGLHEDLNRVRNKPYIEVKDANGRPDEEFAAECWEYHRARNDSVIVDVCQGQYKSTLVCPVCSKVSVTFDPFMYLSLPLPSTVTRTMTVTVLNVYGSVLALPFTVTISRNGSCRDLSQALKLDCCLGSSEDLLLAEVYNNKIYRYLDSAESLSSIKDRDILVAYTLPVNYQDLLRLEIMHSRVERLFEPEYFFHRNLLGVPLVTCLPKDAKTGVEIHAAVCNVLSPLLRAKFSSLNQVKTSNDNDNAPNLDGIVPADESNSCSSDSELFTSNMEIGDQNGGCRSFQLALTDDRCISRTRICSDSVISPGPCIKVLLGWSDEDLELYDFSYLEDLPEVSKSSFKLERTPEESITLSSCFEAFLKEEPLGPDDMWYCPSCKEHRQATKKLDLWRLPEVLVVHLKRFSYSQYMKDKLETFVDFPIFNLDLSKYVTDKAAAASESNIYELYAVSNHYGGLCGGHYTAYAKLVDGDSWYDFDDSHVSSVGEGAIKTSDAYVLFYKRVYFDSGMSGEGSSTSSEYDLC